MTLFIACILAMGACLLFRGNGKNAQSKISKLKKILASILLLSSITAGAYWEELPPDENGLFRESNLDTMKWTSPILYVDLRQKQTDGSYRLSKLEVDADKSCPTSTNYIQNNSPYTVKEVFQDNKEVQYHQVFYAQQVQQEINETAGTVWQIIAPKLCMVALELKAGKKL